MAERPLVALVDDDESVRESLPALLRELGYEARAFASAEEFMATGDLARIRCLILDVMMPRTSGPDLQRDLGLGGVRIPIVFITARADEALRQRLVAHGAVDCLFKPFSDAALAEAVERALDGGDSPGRA
jgi:FixJ family two-component response regulator